jgi:hypothetical protein
MRKADLGLGGGRLSEHQHAVCYAPDMTQGDTAGAACSYGICDRCMRMYDKHQCPPSGTMQVRAIALLCAKRLYI